MAIVALVLAVAAFFFATAAFLRTGGLNQLHEQTDELRERTANLLDRFEHALRPNGELEKTPQQELPSLSKKVDTLLGEQDRAEIEGLIRSEVGVLRNKSNQTFIELSRQIEAQQPETD